MVQAKPGDMKCCTSFSAGSLRSWISSFVKICLAGVLLLLPGSSRLEAAVALPASPCTLAWNLSQDVSVVGYALYFGIAGSSATNRQVLGVTNTVTLFNLLASSNYFFYVVSYNAEGVESLPSNLLYYKPQAVSGLRLTSPARGTVNLQFHAAPGSVCLIQYTPSFNPAQWRVLCTATADANGNIAINDPVSGNVPSRFYRAVLYSNPQVLLALAISAPLAGTITLRFHAATGAVCRVQYTTSLNPPQWQTLGSATADSSGNVAMTDQVSVNTSGRFYRAVTP